MYAAVNFKNIILSTLAIGIVTVIPHLEIIPLPFGYVIPILLFIWLHLKFNKENFSSLGFSFKIFSLKSFLVGTISGVLIFSFLYFIFFPLLQYIIELPDSKVELYDNLKGNTGLYVFLLIMGWLVGGLYEEIVFHGFIFTYIEKLLPKRFSLTVSFLITSIIFGLYHFQLGYDGVINAFLAGIGYHIVILKNKRNLWYGIICHAIFDTIALTLLYFGYI
jgi:membrane protease YdiL (CAAX protease family)